MTATRRLAAILAADVAGYSRLIGADEGGTLQALKAIRAELIDPTIAAHNGRQVKTTGDGLLVEFSSVVDALGCATEVQAGMVAVPAHRAGVNRIFLSKPKGKSFPGPVIIAELAHYAFGSSWPEPPTLRFLKRRTRRLLSNLALTPPFASRRRNPLSCLGRSTGNRVAASRASRAGRRPTRF